jgi:hypothetical protein
MSVWTLTRSCGRSARHFSTPRMTSPKISSRSDVVALPPSEMMFAKRSRSTCSSVRAFEESGTHAQCRSRKPLTASDGPRCRLITAKTALIQRSFSLDVPHSTNKLLCTRQPRASTSAPRAALAAAGVEMKTQLGLWPLGTTDVSGPRSTAPSARPPSESK